MTLLVLNEVTLKLGPRRFGPFDARIEAGQRIAILGASGEGKSTLLKLMSGEHAPAAGQVRIDGRPLRDLTPADLALRRAVLAQSQASGLSMPVELVVSLGTIAQRRPAHDDTVSLALRAARVHHLAGRRFDTLSGGEQARVQLARAFAQLWHARNGLLFVDEPLAALDPGLQFELMDAMQTFTRQRGHALVAVLHDINQALAGFDRLWLVQGGRLVDDLPCDRHAVPRLQALFGIALRIVDSGERGLSVIASRLSAMT